MRAPLPVLTLGFVLAGCSPQGDAQTRKELVGTWVATGNYKGGGSFESKTVVSRNGNYIGHVVVHGESGSVQTADLEGIFQLRDGMLTDTMTKHSDTNAVLPMITRARIVRIDDREMVLKWEAKPGVIVATNDVVFRRIGK